MRCLVIGTARSRSNYLCSALSQKLAVPWLREPYKSVSNSEISTVSQALTQENNCLIKIQVNRLFGRSQGLIDLDLWNFHSYDQIWGTYRRNLVEASASRITAHLLGRFAYNQHEPPPVLGKLKYLPSRDRDLVIQTLLDAAVYQHVVEHLGSGITSLEYADIPEYLAGAASNEFVPTGYNYAELFTNYDDLADTVREFEQRLKGSRPLPPQFTWVRALG